MATALATAVVQNSIAKTDDVRASDILEVARNAFKDATGIECVEDAKPLVPKADVIILAVKPQVAEAAVRALPQIQPSTLVISICAGIPIAKLSRWFNSGRIIRVMPNTPLMVGKGASAFAPGPDATEEDAAFAGRLLGAAGIARQVEEPLLDAVTGLSGSGPAYVFELAQAMALAGEKVGIPFDMAMALSIQTIAGAAEMMVRGIGTPEKLRDAVTSPNGTTAAGLAIMSASDFRGMINSTVEAATKRSVELGK